MYTSLTIAGWVFTLVFTAAVLVPWILGKRHLVSSFNLFILGSINFLSMGMIQNARGISYGAFDIEVTTFLLAMTVFYSCLISVYFWPKKRRASQRLSSYPMDTQNSLRIIAICMSIFGGSASFIPYFPGVQIFYVTNTAITIFAFGVSLIAFLREPKAMTTWFVLAFCGGVAIFTTLSGGTGRRQLLSLLLSVPFICYWVYFRNYPKFRTMVLLTILASFGMVTITAYSTMRHGGREIESSATRVAERLTQLPGKITETVTDFKLFGEQGALLDGQNAVWCALLTIELTQSGALERDPLAMPTFVVVNPIPRAFWQDKPRGLGKVLPSLMNKNRVTWGPSIIGHTFYDGGWPVVFLYGGLFGMMFRWFDLRMEADPTNPWRLALICSVMAHVIALPRGDCGVMLVNIIGPMVVISVILRFFSIWFKRRQVLAGAAPPAYPSIARSTSR